MLAAFSNWIISAGEGPDPEEIITAICVGDTKVAFKSGYDKYLSVDGKGRVVGRSDAISEREQWEPIFQDVRAAVGSINSLAPGGFDYSLKLVNFKLISTINILSFFCLIAIRWMPQHLADH